MVRRFIKTIQCFIELILRTKKKKISICKKCGYNFNYKGKINFDDKKCVEKYLTFPLKKKQRFQRKYNREHEKCPICKRMIPSCEFKDKGIICPKCGEYYPFDLF